MFTAKADGADLVGTGDHANSIDKAVNERLSDSFAMANQPWAKCSRNNRGVLGLVYQGELLAGFQWRFDILEEGDWEGISIVEIWNVA